MQSGARISLGGICTALQVKTTKKGSRFALLRLEDQAGSIKCVAWPEIYSKYSDVLQNDAAVLMTGKLEVTDDGAATVIAEEVARLDEVLQRKSRIVIVKVPVDPEPKKLLENLFGLMDKHRGDCEVLIEMILEGGVAVRARPHSALRVKGSVALEKDLRGYGCHVEWVNIAL
jgi:DNA polymerase-3 subunit alpha